MEAFAFFAVLFSDSGSSEIPYCESAKRDNPLGYLEVEQQVGEEKPAEVVHGQRALDTLGAEPPFRESRPGIVNQQMQVLEAFAHRLRLGAHP
jgi:hypothetical protein